MSSRRAERARGKEIYERIAAGADVFAALFVRRPHTQVCVCVCACVFICGHTERDSGTRNRIRRCVYPSEGEGRAFIREVFRWIEIGVMVAR